MNLRRTNALLESIGRTFTEGTFQNVEYGLHFPNRAEAEKTTAEFQKLIDKSGRRGIVLYTSRSGDYTRWTVTSPYEYKGTTKGIIDDLLRSGHKFDYSDEN